MSKRRNYDEGTHGNQLRGVLCVLVGAISWGFSGACGQFLFSHYNINTAWLSCMRMLVTGVILTIAYIIRERKAAFDIFNRHGISSESSCLRFSAWVCASMHI